jgi:hypothetical protein
MPDLSPASTDLAIQLARLGGELRAALLAVLAAIPEATQGPQRLGAALGLDKVFAHRLLKAVRADDPLAVLQHAPGPDPLTRFLRAARRRGASAESIVLATAAVDRFRAVLREEVGDRSRLDALLSSWLPQSRGEFEVRRKQAVFKAQSQLLGVSAKTNLATVLLHPSADGERIDVVWLVGLYGLQRLRAGARTKLATRRFVAAAPGSTADRRPTTLEGERVEGLEGLRLDRFCGAEPAELEVRRTGEVVHYLLGGEGLGRKAKCDLLIAEVNRAEMPRTPAAGRRPYVFAEVSTPTQLLVFDVLVHHDLYPGAAPELATYDTAFDGVVDVNDPTRAIDRLDVHDTLEVLGPGVGRLPVPEVPRHAELYAHVLASLGWDPDALRAVRTRIDYPLYGSQVVVSFAPPGG